MNTCCEKGTNLTKALAELVLPWEVEWTKVPILSNQSNYSVLSTPPVAKYQTQNTKGEGHTEIDKKKCLEQQNQQTAEQIQLSCERNQGIKMRLQKNIKYCCIHKLLLPRVSEVL